MLGGISASPLYVALDAVPGFAPRGSKSSAAGRVALSGIYGGGKTPSAGVYRVRSYASATVVQDWRPLDGFAWGGGTWSGSASLPVGGPYTLDAGYVDTDGAAWTTTSADVSCGALVAYYGQSNSAGRITGVPGGYAGAATANRANAIPRGVWATGAATSLTYPASYELAKRLSPLLGVPVGVGVAGVAGAGIVFLSPGGGWESSAGGFAAEAPAWGASVECVVWDQGEADADGAFAPSGYAETFLTSTLPGLRAVTKNPSLPVLIDPIGRLAGATAPNLTIGATQNDAQREVLRQQYLLCVAGDPYVFFGASHLGLLHSDGYHYAAAAYVDECRRDAWSVAKYAYGVATHDGRGPVVTGASRSGAVVTLAVDLNGAVALTGPTTLATGTVATQPAGALYGYQVSADNFATLLTISSIAASGGTLVLTLSADPGAPVRVRSMYGWSFDDTVLFYGTYSDTDPIPVWPVMTPLLTGS